MSDHDDIVCQIVRGDLVAAVVLRTEEVVGFLDHRPVFKGHVLLSPVRHVDTLLDLPAELMTPLLTSAQRVAAALVVECVREGITRVDRVAISDTGKLAWAIENRPGGQESGLGRTDGISLPQAVAQPLAESSQQAHQVAINVREQQQAEQRRQAQAVPAHSL